MALEDLTGDKYINALVATNPAATDGKAQGPGHLQGVKNVLKKTFPNLTGPVTLTQAQINQAAFPSGTAMVFAQAAAPVGWVGSVATWDHILRVVDADGFGGTTGGNMNPVTGLTITDPHVLTVSEMPAHAHTVDGFNVGTNVLSTQSLDHANVIPSTETTTTVGGGAGHSHNINWAPRHLNIIVALKS